MTVRFMFASHAQRPFNGWVLLFFLSLFSMVSLAQKNTNKIRSAQLRQNFKDDKLVMSQYTSNYGFAVRNKNLVVTHADRMDMISLESNINHKQTIFYNDNLSVISSSVNYTSGKSLYAEKACGNYEVENVFYSDAKICVYNLVFLFEGTEITFESKTLYNDPKYLTKVFFHDQLAVAERTITFSVPNGVNVELVERNFAGYDIKRTVTDLSGEKVYTYTLKNLASIKAEPNSLGSLHYYPHIVVITKDYQTSEGTKTVIASVDDLYRWYRSLTREVKNDPSPYKALVSQLTASASTPEEKIKRIYYWVQDNIKYIAFEDGIAGFKPDAAQNVYHNRYGDCKGMANLTKEMLKEAGFDARLTWVGTNRIPYSYALPSLAVDNHMICTVFTKDKQYILDPTEKYIALGKHGERIQGKEILIEDGDKYLLKKVPVSLADQNQTIQQESVVLEDEMLKGQGSMIVNGESRKDILYFSNTLTAEDKQKLYEHLVVSDYSTTDNVTVTNSPSTDRDQHMEVNYTYTLKNKVTKFDKDIYLDVDWEKGFKNLKIEPDRQTDYYFNRKMSTKVVKKIKLPSGYKVAHLPKGMNKNHPDFSFAISFKHEGDALIYSNEIIIPQGLIKKSDFTTWNECIKELDELYNDQIVLTQNN